MASFIWLFATTAVSKIRQVRIVLMGPTAEGQRSAANIILGKEAFPESETQRSERHDGIVAGRHLAVITTAELFNSDLSEEEHSQGVRRCLGLSDPGPHVFLWVQQERRITQETWDALRRFKESFGEGVSRYSMVMFMHEDHEEYASVGDSARPGDAALQDFIQDCGGQYHFHSQRNQTQATELLEKIQEIVEENRGSYFIREVPKYPDITWKGVGRNWRELNSREELEVDLRRLSTKSAERPLSRPLSREERPRFSRSRSVNAKRDRRECVRMVLVGKTGAGKSATGNTILGREAFTSRFQMNSVTKKCRKETGRVGGREVAVIDTPGLYDTTLSPEDVQLEIMKCMGLASPGPHVFLLVVSLGRFTPEESETLRFIEMTFGDKAEKYTMVLFTRGDELADQSIEDFIAEGDPEVKKLIENCGGRYHVMNNKEKDRWQVFDLFKKIEKMNHGNGGTCYTRDMFLEAEKAMTLIEMRKDKEQEVKEELKMLHKKYKYDIEYIYWKATEERKSILRGRQERTGRGVHHKRQNDEELWETLGYRETRLEGKAGDDEGREGRDGGTRKPGQHVKESQEVGEEEEEHKPDEKQERDEEGSEKQTEQKAGKKIKLFTKMALKGRGKTKPSGQNKTEYRREGENDGEEKERSKKKNADKKETKVEKAINERKAAQSSDIKSKREEGKPEVQQRNSDKRQGVKEKRVGEDSAREKLTEEEYKRLVDEVSRVYEDLVKQQTEELKSFFMKHPDNFQATKRKKCVIQ